MPEVSEESLAAFRKWKIRHAFPELTLARQKDLREFKERFGVDTRSNFHCLWCYTGTLYDCVDPTAPGIADITIPEGYQLYICRSCQLRFLIKCCDSDILAQEIARKKQERKEKREATKTGKKDADVIQSLIVESFQTKMITCLGCGEKLTPDTDFCTCGWKNPLVGMGNEPPKETDND